MYIQNIKYTHRHIKHRAFNPKKGYTPTRIKLTSYQIQIGVHITESDIIGRTHRKLIVILPFLGYTPIKHYKQGRNRIGEPL